MATVRRELVHSARSKVAALIAAEVWPEYARHDISYAHLALEFVIDGARHGTLGEAMRNHYLSISETSLTRLLHAVAR